MITNINETACDSIFLGGEWHIQDTQHFSFVGLSVWSTVSLEFIRNLSEISRSFFHVIICQSPLKPLRTLFTKSTFSAVLLNNKFATTHIFFHICRKHKFYEQYILYYCTFVLVEIVFFHPLLLRYEPCRPWAWKRKKLYMSKLIQHERAIQNLSYKYTLFRPTNTFFTWITLTAHVSL